MSEQLTRRELAENFVRLMHSYNPDLPMAPGMKAQFLALRSALDSSLSEDTYGIRHNGETTWLRGSVAVAAWVCDTYGMDKAAMMETLVAKVEASVKLVNEDLGLTVVNLTRGGKL